MFRDQKKKRKIMTNSILKSMITMILKNKTIVKAGYNTVSYLDLVCIM